MKKIAIVALVGLGFMACAKSESCYDPDLKERYKDIFCTTDCPGFKACNGETYCNECVAATHGFGPE
ncbi:MAG: hypothetical protein MK078_02790 [Crocinitomicaceae bacterium]|nr:hypothetical protein [Crocinitomicaceae bacterium]